MVKTITQKVVFKNATPQQLYDLYMDAKKHALVTGASVSITKKEGSAYKAHGNYISGKNLLLVPGKMIVQTWRAQDWNKDDQDSVFALQFEKQGANTILHMAHSFVPAAQAEEIKKGWTLYYWKPWAKFLAGKK
jgi:activator of HSP90 ATPase